MDIFNRKKVKELKDSLMATKAMQESTEKMYNEMSDKVMDINEKYSNYFTKKFAGKKIFLDHQLYSIDKVVAVGYVNNLIVTQHQTKSQMILSTHVTPEEIEKMILDATMVLRKIKTQKESKENTSTKTTKKTKASKK